MTTIKKIFNKLHNANKLELANEKVELSIARDIQQSLAELKNIIGDVENKRADLRQYFFELEEAQEKYDGSIDDTRDVINMAEREYETAYDYIQRAEEMANELGVNPSEINNYDELVSVYDETVLEVNETRAFISNRD